MVGPFLATTEPGAEVAQPPVLPVISSGGPDPHCPGPPLKPGGLLPNRIWCALDGTFEPAAVGRAGQAFEGAEADMPARLAHGTFDSGIADRYGGWMVAPAARDFDSVGDHLDCLPGASRLIDSRTRRVHTMSPETHSEWPNQSFG